MSAANAEACEMQVLLIALLALVNTSLGAVLTSTNSVKAVKRTIELGTKTSLVSPVRRNGGKKRSTSSSSGEAPALGRNDEDKEGDSNSLGIMDSTDKTSDEDNHTVKGWKAWHRKCTQCPEDMVKKWRDPTIKWICGGYQRARRSFKSECMMRYRNCQDGTMFVKIHTHRCDEKAVGYSGGRHFFYDYSVKISEESSESEVSLDSDSSSEETDESLPFAFTFDV